MNDAVEASVLGSLITGGFALIVVLVQRVHATVNSRMTEMLAIVRKSSHAEGVKDEKEEQKKATENNEH
jgi:hypothetical protein